MEREIWKADLKRERRVGGRGGGGLQRARECGKGSGN